MSLCPAYAWEIREGNLELVGTDKCLRGKRAIHFRIFSALRNTPGHFNLICELILLQSTLD